MVERGAVWVAQPHLRASGRGRAALDYPKLRKLAGSTLDANNTDGKLNYEECRIKLGLPSRYGFHLRSYPVITANAGNQWGTATLPPLRVAYIGDWSGGNWDGLLQAATGVEIASSTIERGDLKALNVIFANTLYKPGNGILPAVEGDVYADYNNPGQDDADGPGGDNLPYVMKSLFSGAPQRADRYDIIVVGSDVRPEHFGNGVGDFSVKLKDWVNSGKLLLVLGTDDDNVGWLDDTLGAAAKAAPGALTTPDDSHAFLTTPNRLSVGSYTPAVRADDSWNLNDVTSMTIVLGSKPQAHLGLSNDGKYTNEGAAFVMSMQPGEFASRDEARKVFANAFVYKFLRPAYIDYGPEMDPDALARSATRIVPIELQSGANIDAKIVLFMWRSG
jgi:hypothetical protein